MSTEVSKSIAEFEDFLAGFQGILEAVKPELGKELAVKEVDEFLADFEERWDQFAKENEINPPFINIWDVAGLDKDEVRNCKILKWLLDPRESHFQRSRFFRCLLEHMHIEPALENTDEIRVRPQVYIPEGNCILDIVIEGETFFICIEAKIDAPESEEQLHQQYNGVHESGILEGRRFIGKYLTRHGESKRAVTEGFTRLLWRDVASALRRFSTASGPEDELVAKSPFVRDLARHYAGFIMAHICHDTERFSNWER